MLELLWEELFHRFIWPWRWLNQSSIWSSWFYASLWLPNFFLRQFDLAFAFSSTTISRDNRSRWAIRSSRGLPIFIYLFLFFLWLGLLFLAEFIFYCLVLELEFLVKSESLTDDFRNRQVDFIFPITTFDLYFIDLRSILPEFKIILHLIRSKYTRMCLPCRVQRIVHRQNSSQQNLRKGNR